MTLLQIINAQYEQAIRELDNVINYRKDTAQSRYDRKKALAKGHEPKRYTAGAERIRHELFYERRWVLKGALEALEYVAQNYEHFKAASFDEWMEEMIADVEAAIDEGTEANSQEAD